MASGAPHNISPDRDPGDDLSNHSGPLDVTTADPAAVTGSPGHSGSIASSWFRSVQFASPGGGNRGGRSGSISRDVGEDDAMSSGLLDDDDARDPYDNGDLQGDWPPTRRRRSSVGARLAALTDIGGVNSIRSFARSFQRAAAFTEVIPQRPSFVFAADHAPIFGPGVHGDAAIYDSDIETSGAASPSGVSGVSGVARWGPVVSPVSPPPSTSLLQQHLAEAGQSIDDASIASVLPPPSELSSATPSDDQQQQPQDLQQDHRHGGPSERKSLLPESGSNKATRTFRAGSTSSIFGLPPALALSATAPKDSRGAGTPPAVVGSPGILSGGYGSYEGSFRSRQSYRMSGGGYGSVDSAAGLTSDAAMAPGEQATSMAQAGALWREQQEEDRNLRNSGRPAILVKEVEEDGKIILTVEGQSTLYQTIFNSINVLIGVGLLSLPMGIRYAGWICGLAILFSAATVTAYTARLLAKCMDLDPAVITFSDLAFISFGPRARLMTSLLFTVELLAACVALIVLFADSLGLLFPGLLSVNQWKVLCCLIMVPLNFLPMRLLSVTSIIGIVCCFGIVCIVVIDGITKKTAPGSLLEPAATYMFPANWLTLPLSFGLLMSPWGGHSVFPNIYRDMRHPYKYAHAVKVTFSFTYLLDLVTAVAGILMFGDDVMDEITANILTTSGYPRALTVLLCMFIAIIPLTKIPLNARPIISTLEVLTGVYQQAVLESSAPVGRPAYLRGITRTAIRVATIVVFLIIAILFPDFDSIMAFMGSALCFTICVTLPILFHLKLFGHDLTQRDKMFQYVVLTLSVVTSIVGTVWSFLPKSMIVGEN